MGIINFNFLKEKQLWDLHITQHKACPTPTSTPQTSRTLKITKPISRLTSLTKITLRKLEVTESEDPSTLLTEFKTLETNALELHASSKSLLKILSQKDSIT